MAVDIQKYFNEVLPTVLAKNPDAVKQIDAKYKWVITGDQGGEWSVDASNSGPSVTKGDLGDANSTLTINSQDFQALFENPQANTVPLYFSGKLIAQGNPTLVPKITEIFSLRS